MFSHFSLWAERFGAGILSIILPSGCHHTAWQTTILSTLIHCVFALYNGQSPRPIEWDGLVSKLHRNSAYLERRAALISALDTSGVTDKDPVLAQSCRASNVRSVTFLAPTRSAWRV